MRPLPKKDDGVYAGKGPAEIDRFHQDGTKASSRPCIEVITVSRKKQAVVTEPFYRRSDEWMMVFCISRKYLTRMARYASDTLEFYLRTVLDGLNMGCLVPTIPTGRSHPKGCMLMVKNTDFGQSIIQMGKWLRVDTTHMAKSRGIGSFGVAMVRRKKARTTPFQARRCTPRHPRLSARQLLPVSEPPERK